MASDSDKRRFSRHPVGLVMFSVILETPGQADFHLAPEDIGIGGFRLVVPLKLTPGGMMQCSIELKGKRYENCSAKVAWVREVESSPGQCEAGLAPGMEHDGRREFHVAMLEHLKEEGNLP